MNIPFLAKNFVMNAMAGFPSTAQFSLGSRSTMALNSNELHELARAIPLRTREIYAPNDYYGHATILKRYTDMAVEKSLKTVVEHGPFFGGFVWNEDLNSRLPAIIVFSKARFPFLRPRTDKPLYAIGPIIAYAPHFLSDKALREEKRRLKRNLLVFPAHSTHHVDSEFDVSEYCRHLAEISRGFDTVRICLYWKDVLRGRARAFREHGFECVTAGHIYDPLFLPRLKSIIECATMTTSNELGTHLGYCVLMGKPHHIFCHSVVWRAKFVETVLRDAPDRSTKPDIIEIKKVFSDWQESISQCQKELVEHYWGVNEVKTSEELRLIFCEAEELYRRQRRSLSFYRDRYRWMVTR